MRRTLRTLLVAVALATVIGCGANPPSPTPAPPSATAVPAGPTATQAAAVQPSPTALPSATPRPTRTLVPTVTRRPQPTPTPEPVETLSPEIVATMETIEMEMEALRGLDESEPITRTLVSRQGLGAYLDQQFREDYPAEEIEADVRVLAAFDFVDEDFDLRQVLLDIYSTEVLGLYEDEENTLYVVTEGGFSLLNRLTFAHEYVHGLQDQNFDLEAFVDEDKLSDDEILARMALIEGDASQAMGLYLILHLSDLSSQDIEELTGEADSGEGAALASAPAILRETVLFPYTYGQEFVSALYEGGWGAVDAAFAEPPRSTEQILHPEKYLDGDEPQIVALPPLTDTLGTGWTLLESEVLGEFQTALYLAQQVDQETVEVASQGWGGDRYDVYSKGATEVLVFASAWDTGADREEFVDAYRQYAEAKYRGVGLGTEAKQLWWDSPGEATLLAWGDDRVFIVDAPDVETVQRILNALGL